MLHDNSRRNRGGYPDVRRNKSDKHEQMTPQETRPTTTVRMIVFREFQFMQSLR
jgi:hypothetical protein